LYNKKAVLSQLGHIVMCLIYECPESFRMYIENLKCIALAIPEIIAIRVLVRVVNANVGEEDIGGITDGTIRTSVDDFL